MLRSTINNVNEILYMSDKEISNFLMVLRGQPYLFYGPAFTGKTTLCISYALQEIKKGQHVLYIDTELGINPVRIKQMATCRGIKAEDINKYLRIIRIQDFGHLKKCLSNEMRNSVELVIIDSISRPVVRDLIKNCGHFSRTKVESSVFYEYYVQLADLLEELIGHGVTVLCTSEIVYETPVTMIVGKKMLRFAPPLPLPHLSILFKNIAGLIVSNGRRYMFIERHSCKPSVYETKVVLEFKITNKGLVFQNLVEVSGDELKRIIVIE